MELFQQRLGLFIHWGLYSIPGYHEQMQQRLSISRAEYVSRLCPNFLAESFNADAWVLLAKSWGMTYIILTAKHHDGYCLWATEQTEYNTFQGPMQRDIVKQLSVACERHGVLFGLYYSCVDWHHKNYPNEGRHHELAAPEPGDEPNMEAYMSYVRAQVRELCDGRYGNIAAFWWDMNVPEHRDTSLNAIIRELQPKCLINNRGFSEGDFSTPEREWDKDNNWKPYTDKVEACNSMDALSWGYRKEPQFYTVRHLQASIARYIARGGNYLLNIGPDSEGNIDERYTQKLLRIGTWFHRVSEAFRATESIAPLPYTSGQVVTRYFAGNVLYIFITETLISEGLSLKPIHALPTSARLLNYLRPNDVHAPVDFSLEILPYETDRVRPYLWLKLPLEKLALEVPVIRLEFEPGALDALDIVGPVGVPEVI